MRGELIACVTDLDSLENLLSDLGLDPQQLTAESVLRYVYNKPVTPNVLFGILLIKPNTIITSR